MDRECPACGGALASWISARSAEPDSDEPISLLRCSACGSAVTLTPAPPDAHDSGAYATARPRLSVALAPLLRWFDRRRLARLEAPNGARLLDVGAGRGRFVATALASGFQAGGIEPSRRGVTAAASEYGVALQQATLAQADVEPGSLQVVTLWHVLEHLDDPGEALEAIARWLEPGGLLLVGAPNLASLQARIGGPRWYHLDLPRHRTHFTATGLETLLRRHGFEPLRTSHLVAEQNLYGMWQTLVNRFTRTPSYLYNLLKRNAPARPSDLAVTVAFLPMTIPAALLELAAGLARRGGTITVLARPASARRS
jgi:2-polyprenyl-3-methyl-5-hydroxy-6-metoxy-1,4-benzoquinol methylase